MKTLHSLVAAAVAAAFCTGSLAPAQPLNDLLFRPQGGPTFFGDHGGDDRSGLHLIATAAAPAGANGEAQLDLSVAAAPSLKIEVNGLEAGTYTVSITTTASATAVSLGTFDVLATTAVGTPTLASLPLPSGFDPDTLVLLQIANAGGTALLSASRSGKAPADRHPEFRLAPTANAPTGARGEAQVDTTVPAAPALDLEVHGLAAGTYTVDAVSLATGMATALGTFDVTAPTTGASEATASLTLPAGFDMTDLASVQVLDANGAVILSADGSCRGGDVAGTEHLHQLIALTATAAAPAGLSGRAELEAHDQQGTSGAVLAIGVKGLAAGTYTVSVTSQATGASTTLGTITATGSGKDRLVIGSMDGLAFPDGFNPLDIEAVQVADANGVVLLTGDFSIASTVITTSYVAKVRTIAGAAAPASTGSAVIVARVVGKAVAQAFALVAKGAPASSTLTMMLNGTAVGTVKTNRTGGLMVSKLPAGTEAHKITSVTLETAAGARVLGAYF